MDELGYTRDQIEDAATDYVLAAQSGRLAEANLRANIGRTTFGAEAWLAEVNRVSATGWVGMSIQ